MFGMLCFSLTWQNPLLCFCSHYADRYHGLALAMSALDHVLTVETLAIIESLRLGNDVEPDAFAFGRGV